MLSPGQFELPATEFPVRFRTLTSKVEHEAETISLAPESLIIVTGMKLHVGERLTLSIRFPMLSDGSFCEIDFNGRVVCGDKLADGQFGCQIEIERNSSHIAFKHS
jgi:hypothetical protein